ncbi:MAG TPA: hypothetical protein DEV97_05250 [Lachnospiraceae bacterium]|nr:hypothetical protein [Lachnospiraceae bacterium]
MNEMGKRLRNLRTDRQLSQKELASRVGLSGQVISNLERGYTELTIEQASKLAQFFRVSTDYLLDSPSQAAVDLHTLSDDELKLVKAYRELSEDYRDVVMGELKKALLAQRREAKEQ